MQVPVTAPVRFRVGEFEVDLRCGELRFETDFLVLVGLGSLMDDMGCLLLVLRGC
jgi:hypothetical protein